MQNLSKLIILSAQHAALCNVHSAACDNEEALDTLFTTINKLFIKWIIFAAGIFILGMIYLVVMAFINPNSVFDIALSTMLIGIGFTNILIIRFCSILMCAITHHRAKSLTFCSAVFKEAKKVGEAHVALCEELSSSTTQPENANN